MNARKKRALPRKARRNKAGARPPAPKYDLRASQIETPLNIVKFFWRILKEHRKSLGTVLDMGAGDGRFARYGFFRKYSGLEIDPGRIVSPRPAKNARVQKGCVFSFSGPQVDACIGNPPYLRHHDIESPWKEKTLARLGKELGAPLSGHANLFLYFIAWGLLRTTDDGLTALLVPFDWVSRPSGRGLREAIQAKGWSVSIYRFDFPVFRDVDTTACISIIDKSSSEGHWRFFDVSEGLKVVPRRGVTGTGTSLLRYVGRTERGQVFARRGLSPGKREVFILSEGERIHHGLSLEDVTPCVTSLRGIDEDLQVLNQQAFRRHFVDGGRRCWLIKSKNGLSPELRRYLDDVEESKRSTATCLKQVPWYNYEEVKVPGLLVHSGFTGSGPRVVVNPVGAIPAGSMFGVYGCPKKRLPELRKRLTSRRILARVVPHSGRLRKVEVGQLNGVLASLEGVDNG